MISKIGKQQPSNCLPKNLQKKSTFPPPSNRVSFKKFFFWPHCATHQLLLQAGVCCGVDEVHQRQVSNTSHQAFKQPRQRTKKRYFSFLAFCTRKACWKEHTLTSMFRQPHTGSCESTLLSTGCMCLRAHSFCSSKSPSCVLGPSFTRLHRSHSAYIGHTALTSGIQELTSVTQHLLWSKGDYIGQKR